MEALPQEIADKIFDPIFQENPRALYRLRLVSETWENIINQSLARLFKKWCKKCSNKIPQSYRDNFVQIRYPQFESWEVFCLNENASMTHIARDIYLSWHEFPNLVGHPRFTEICSPDISDQTSIQCYAVNEKYFAVCLTMLLPAQETKHVVRIYPTNNVTHYIREYPILCKKIDFYATNNEVFIILQKRKDYYKLDKCKRIALGEFLVNDCLVHLNLPFVDESMRHYTKYTTINNQCFTYRDYCSSFQHLRLTSHGFETNAIVKVPSLDDKFGKITKIQIHDSTLFLDVIFSNDSPKARKAATYLYRITEKPDNKLLFSLLRIYEAIPLAVATLGAELPIIAGADNINLDFYNHYRPGKFRDWVNQLFDQRTVGSITVYAHHVIIACEAKLIVFQGNLGSLMDYAAKNSNPGARCIVINLRPTMLFRMSLNPVQVIHTDSKPQFLIVTTEKIFILDLIP